MLNSHTSGGLVRGGGADGGGGGDSGGGGDGGPLCRIRQPEFLQESQLQGTPRK